MTDPTRDERETAFRAALRYALAVSNDDAMIDGLPDNDLEGAGAAFAVACRDYVRAVDRHPQAVQWPHQWEPDDTAKLRNQVADLTEQNTWLRATVERNDRVIGVFVDHHCQHPLPEDVRKQVVAAMDSTGYRRGDGLMQHAGAFSADDALAVAVTRLIELAAASPAEAVELLRAALAHDWTDAIPAHVRDEYEHCWAQAFVDTVTRLATAAEPSPAAEPLTN